MISTRGVFVSLIATLVAGCATASGSYGCRPNEQSAIVDSLYFGTAMPSGQVSPVAWQKFLSDVITPRFPEGLTAWSAAGQWRNAAGELTKEDSYVLNVVHKDEAKYETAVREIIDIYKAQFRQEAVLRVRSTACTSF